MKLEEGMEIRIEKEKEAEKQSLLKQIRGEESKENTTI